MLTVSPAETVKLGAEIGFDGSCGPYTEMVEKVQLLPEEVPLV